MKQELVVLMVILLTVAFTSAGYSQTTTIKKEGTKIIYKDKFGNVTGTATKAGNTTTFRDPDNKITGTAVTSGKKTTIRNSKGKRVATVRKPGN